MSKSNKAIVVGIGNLCPKCGDPMERRKHKKRPKSEYFFTEWDYCKPCGHVQHYEKYRSSVWQEHELIKTIFNSL